ncbi:hypothetical protein ACQP2Y_21970 [Actinoplanes sp. CA-051413]|uniref:hypothetical protein n=1 Tax=Actinoplanes sp. CA-051413 TaxID=3239899 RepID=UPI003D9750CF
MSEKPRRSYVRFNALVQYWAENYTSVLPDLPAGSIGWNEPFCFRCGWLAPTPDDDDNPWRRMDSWLEKAHLQDHVGGGPDTAENIVPLCAICHRGMPDFPDSRAAALAWVKAQGHSSCPSWWQQATDALWGGDRFKSFPGSVVFFNTYFVLSQRRERIGGAFSRRDAGDLEGALSSLRFAGLDGDVALAVLDDDFSALAAAVGAA